MNACGRTVAMSRGIAGHLARRSTVNVGTTRGSRLRPGHSGPAAARACLWRPGGAEDRSIPEAGQPSTSLLSGT